MIYRIFAADIVYRILAKLRGHVFVKELRKEELDWSDTTPDEEFDIFQARDDILECRKSRKVEPDYVIPLVVGDPKEYPFQCYLREEEPNG